MPSEPGSNSSTRIINSRAHSPARGRSLRLGEAASTQPAPADTLLPYKTKTVEQAVGLLRQAIDRTASQWEPNFMRHRKRLLQIPAADFLRKRAISPGVRSQNGYFWTGSFWTGELWQLYSATHDEKYGRSGRTLGFAAARPGVRTNHDADFYPITPRPSDLTPLALPRLAMLRCAPALCAPQTGWSNSSIQKRSSSHLGA